MRVKRWMLLTLLGLLLVVAGIALAVNIGWSDYLESLDELMVWVFAKTSLDTSDPKVSLLMGLILVSTGLLLVFVSYFQFNRSILSTVAPEAREDLADRIFQRRSLAQGHRIVVIGGGTGLSTMLRGLKERTSNIVAIVTVTEAEPIETTAMTTATSNEILPFATSHVRQPNTTATAASGKHPIRLSPTSHDLYFQL